MKRAVLLLAVVSRALATPVFAPNVEGSVALLDLPPPLPQAQKPAPEPEPSVPSLELPPPPLPAESGLRLCRAAEEEEDEERASFLSLLEELQAIARDERSEQGYNYFALIGVFENPLSERPLVFAERVPIDLQLEPEPDSSRHRRQWPTLNWY